MISREQQQQQKLCETRHVGQVVQRRVEQWQQFSKLKGSGGSDVSVQELNWRDVKVGALLGKGTYSRVYHATVRGGGGASKDDAAFALKRLDPTIQINSREFRTGSADLALEAKLLERLHHDNIIRLHVVKSGNLVDSIQDSSYFCLLDLLDATLEERLCTWRAQTGGAAPTEGCSSGITNLITKLRSGWTTSPHYYCGGGRQDNLLHRVETVALGIANGMAYLHSQGIVFRDLKPQNVGFSNGTVKIFDFGIARELEACREMGMKLGFAGTPRYMAPEIGSALKYGLSADVYSFAIVLWELCSLKRPFEKMTTLHDYQATVISQDGRPPLFAVKGAASRELRTLIQDCWQRDASTRPTFSEIVRQLKDIVSANKETIILDDDADVIIVFEAPEMPLLLTKQVSDETSAASTTFGSTPPTSPTLVKRIHPPTILQ